MIGPSITTSIYANFLNNIGGDVDPVPGALLNYKLDGTDSSLVRVGTDDYRIAPACPEAIGSWFDGSTQVWNADADSAVVAVGAGAFSWCLWVNFTKLSVNERFVSTGSANAGTGEFEIFHDGAGRVRFRYNNTSFDIALDDAAYGGEWHHVAVTMTGASGTMKGYVDGVEVKSGSAPNYNITDSGSLRIGGRPTGDLKLQGGLDDIRFYDRVLTPTEVTALNNSCDFNPSQLTTQAWYDTSDVPTITESGGSVSQWDDKSGNGHNLTQGTASSQMSTGLQSINGLNVLSSTTADRFMENLTFPVPASGNISIAFVAKIDGQTASTSSSLISMDATKDWQIMADNTTQFNGALNAAALGSFDRLSGGPYTGPDIWTVVFDFDNTTKKIFVNGVEKASGSYNNAMDSVQTLRIFANRGGASPVFGLFGEMTIREDVTDAQRQLIEGYLAWKWGLVASLDAGHPYKSAPPKE